MKARVRLHFRGTCMLMALLFALAFPLPASANCGKARITRLADAGKTVASIAESCDMEVNEVQDILDEAPVRQAKKPPPPPDDEDPDGLPRGTVLGQCGCWGPVLPQHRQPTAECASGYARPKMCPGMCPAGGSPWVGVCT